jgi:hypothetical protein
MAVNLVDGPEPLLESQGRAWLTTFGDTARPRWFLYLTMTEVETDQFRCTEARFVGVGVEDLPEKWVARFPLARCVRESRLLLAQLLAGEDLYDADLPYGYPNRANRAKWYPALYRAVQRWQRTGMTPMDSYREVARRKKVEVNRVKQWIHVAKKLTPATENEGDTQGGCPMPSMCVSTDPWPHRCVVELMSSPRPPAQRRKRS